MTAFVRAERISLYRHDPTRVIGIRHRLIFVVTIANAMSKIGAVMILYIHCSFLHLALFETIFPQTMQRETPCICTRYECKRHDLLVDLLAVEGNAEGAEEQSAVSVVSGGSVDGNVEARNHLGRVPFWKQNTSVSLSSPTLFTVNRRW